MMIKKIIISCLVVGAMLGDVALGLQANVNDEGDIIVPCETTTRMTSVKFKELITQATNDTVIDVVGTDYSPRHANYIVELSNGSWVVYNRQNDTIHFQPVELGDWDYTFDYLKDAMNCISMYSQRQGQLIKEI